MDLSAFIKVERLSATHRVHVSVLYAYVYIFRFTNFNSFFWSIIQLLDVVTDIFIWSLIKEFSTGGIHWVWTYEVLWTILYLDALGFQKSIVLRHVKKRIFLCNINNHSTWLMTYKILMGLTLSQRYAGDYLIVLVLHFCIAPNYYWVIMGRKVTWTLNIWKN